MVSSNSAAPLLKGQLRCFECKIAIQAKNGQWQSDGHREVFVCTPCQNKQKAKARAGLGKPEDPKQ